MAGIAGERVRVKTAIIKKIRRGGIELESPLSLICLTKCRGYVNPKLINVGAPAGIRTPNLLIRSQMLYPVELRAQFLFFSKTLFNYAHQKD